MRSEAREAVLKILYSRQMNPTDVENVKKNVLMKLTEEEFDFASRLLELVEGHEEHIIQVINENMQHYMENRLFPIDKAALLIGVAEILYCDEIPPVISASEATNMVQKYSTEKSADFVNGVLAGVIKQCTKS